MVLVKSNEVESWTGHDGAGWDSPSGGGGFLLGIARVKGRNEASRVAYNMGNETVRKICRDGRSVQVFTKLRVHRLDLRLCARKASMSELHFVWSKQSRSPPACVSCEP